ncbi:steryl-sulfatase-like isoform X2 [Littorina saxatilis]|uniref:steryl-sulfatase-like isoform X2 n=1 Tax=Littorina saxatilis TaxID=31220 RepID=UPI0038B60AB1
MKAQHGTMTRSRIHLMATAMITLTLTITNCQGDERPPNVLLFMADDLGYGDLGCYGNTTLRTPNIDRLASEGAKLTHSLTAASICTPSRAAFLTGRYPIRSGMASPHFVRVSFLTACNTGLPVSELTFAELAKQAGYTTALLGKWHLGWSTDRSDPDHKHPLNQGFDYFYGIPLTKMKDFDSREVKAWRRARPTIGWILTMTCVMTLVFTWSLIRLARLGRTGSAMAVVVMVTVILTCGLVYWVMENLELLNSFFYRNYELVEQPIILPQVTRKLVREGVEFLEQRHADSQPFLLFVSWLHVHTALDTAPQFRGQSLHGPYGDAVEELDWGVGQLLDTLDRLGLTDTTLVIFTSDNGAHVEESDFLGRRSGGYNGGLRGGKAHGAPDGGIRVPTILKWPGKVTPGHVTDEPISLMDVMPTIAHALHVQLPANHVVDGKDLLPLLSGEEKRSPHEFLFHYCQDEVHAVRYRPRDGSKVWKMALYEPAYLLQTDHCDFLCRCHDATPLDPPLLFDLTSDPGEQHPLSAADLPEYRALVNLMTKALRKHKDSIVPVPNMFSVYNMLWRPWNQPNCNFPEFQCSDSKFGQVFDEDVS